MNSTQNTKVPFFKTVFQSTEDVVSMFLGLAIVVVVFLLVINFFHQKKSGNVELAGVSSTPTTAVIVETKDKTVEPKIEKVTAGEYVVAKGDSLWKISEKMYGTGYSWTVIAKTNQIKTPGVLTVGQKIQLPAGEKKITATKETVKTIESDHYVVAKGDSLSKIALWAYGDQFQWTKIWEANKKIIGTNPRIIYSGQELVIPRTGNATIK